MKIKVTRKDIRNNFRHVFSCGYCDLQNIFNGESPRFYNCGVYGWNFDVFTDYEHDLAITTGYRNMIGKSIPYELIRDYDTKARQIMTWENKTPYEEKQKLIEQLRKGFIEQLLKL